MKKANEAAKQLHQGLVLALASYVAFLRFAASWSNWPKLLNTTIPGCKEKPRQQVSVFFGLYCRHEMEKGVRKGS